MSVVDDAAEINDFFHLNDVDPPVFTDLQQLFATDNNLLSYEDGIIRFDSFTMLSQHVLWANAYVTIPISVSSSVATAPYSAATQLMFREGTNSIVTGVSFGEVSGNYINEQSGQVYWMNLVRQSLNHGADWIKSESGDVGFTPIEPTYSGADILAACAAPERHSVSMQLNFWARFRRT